MYTLDAFVLAKSGLIEQETGVGGTEGEKGTWQGIEEESAEEKEESTREGFSTSGLNEQSVKTDCKWKESLNEAEPKLEWVLEWD